MLAALLIAPIFALALVNGGEAVAASAPTPEGYWNAFTSWSDIISGLGWGLGYFGIDVYKRQAPGRSSRCRRRGR